MTAFDPRRILEVLVNHGVEFVVVGGIGTTLHGSPYPTYDLDVCPTSDLRNRKRLAGALRDLGAKEWDPRRETAIETEWSAETLAIDRTWMLMTSGGRLDLLFAPAGAFGFKDLARRKVHYDLEGLDVAVAHLEDIIRMKEAAGRDRDRVQLPTLRKLLERRRD